METNAATSGSASIGLRVIGDISGSFFVPSYQRGYRWGEHEVRCLLDDIWTNRDPVYCLQPVVVKSKGDNGFELVDGQQRFTTLYVLARYLERQGLGVGPRYSITYETRQRSGEFLATISGDDNTENIDFFHMSRAYRAIAAWFQAREGEGVAKADAARRLGDALSRRVKVIWYEAPPEVDSVALFTRLNAGRIPLTSAELLKALLLSRNVASALGRPEEVAAQWDSIERELQDADYWHFLTNLGEAVRPTRIELLFELLTDVEGDRRGAPYGVFDAHRARVERDREGFWRDVLTLRAALREWYEDHDRYHQVGYLIATGTPLRALWRDAKDTPRSAFREKVIARVRGTVATTKKARTLSYRADGDLCAHLLMLANVEAVRRRQPQERYPFRAHKAQRWSLEHVNPQSGDAVRTTEERRRWLRDHHAVLADYPVTNDAERATCAALLTRIASAAEDLDGETYVELARDIVAFLAPEESLDEIGNLALLSADDNSALSNATFPVKQRQVIERDRGGSFIPVCTLRLFLKYDSPPVLRRLPRWTEKDRDAYLAALFGEKNGLVAPWMAPETLS